LIKKSLIATISPKDIVTELRN